MLDLGFNTERYAVQDLISTEDWAQEMIVGPSQGVIFLFQETEPQRTFATAEKATLNAANNTPNLFYMKQLAHNACGTIALFHVLLNAVDTVPDIIKEGSYLAEFKAKQNKSPNEIGEEFKASKNVKEIHKDASNEGQSEAAESVDSHFIAFIVKDGSLY
jgi:ubiquitin carboxyl-terminal hydrolase L3